MTALDKMLGLLNKEDMPELERVQRSIIYCKKALKIIRTCVYQNVFDTPEAEIYFFKYTKPLFYSKFIYYVNIYRYLIQRPPGGEEALQAYVSFHLAELQRFFDSNKAFYQYYRSGSEQMDHSYFTRDGYKLAMEPEEFEEDEHYSTSHDYKISKIMANEKLQAYFKYELARTGRDDLSTLGKPFPFRHPQWTASQTDAVELLYALKTGCAVNNGNIDIAELVAIWEFIFQIELKESYHKLLDISKRKKEMFVFLVRLRDSLWNFIREKFE
ncbi:hypothetical protein GWR56_13845 [Mucilaginibacter sp. 14171R-50]|uniref:RteC domain-containing protein n=1 Tax=Mucilaginibacter sp. 14171R-50 TaxID=2703789 RepID=UPI00138D9E2E|nr:RteC domain-containing protein [Mucilaginibacter sp. 14171R-50]QHS56572.1 hypothetical protein GWR56_13845 [Mucilaginibacter sp. 14171R-50]